MAKEVRIYFHGSAWSKKEQARRAAQSPFTVSLNFQKSNGEFIEADLKVTGWFNVNRDGGSVDLDLQPEDARKLASLLKEIADRHPSDVLA